MSKVDALDTLIPLSIAYAEQVVEMLLHTVTTDAQLCFSSKLVPGGSIGKHLRHIHDHFRILIESLTPSALSSQATELCYDSRSRNLASESSVEVAKTSFIGLQEMLKHVGHSAEGVRVVLDAVTPTKIQLESTWSRELWFACLHATHHFALIRVIAANELGLTIPSDFGTAPSTLVYREETQQQLANGKL